MVVRNIKKKLRRVFERRWNYEIEPDEIFVDASNLPAFDESQFEGRFERPASKLSLLLLGLFFLGITLTGVWKVWSLRIAQGGIYADLSENNRLHHSVIFPARGVIYDRSGVLLAWNNQGPEDSFPKREYASTTGLSPVVGFVNYPQKDTSGFYFQDTYIGKDGIEKEFDDSLGGQNGLNIIETDALGAVQSQSTINPPIDGKDITLSIDAKINQKLYEKIAQTAKERGFRGGAGAILDVHTGEILALASFPDYNSQVMSEGKDASLIARYLADSGTPFLNRVVSGLYAPGSIVKPFVALGALDQGIIDPQKIIVSTGSIKVPNPYAPGEFSIFKDWKSLGPLNMRQAIAYSSDVYFYEVGGGFEGQRGLGISNIDKYMKLFGIGEETGVNLPGEVGGNIPTPLWKKETFPADPLWRIGDTYNTAIGQYGFQVTPLQMVRGLAAIANDGELLTPTILKTATTTGARVPISPDYFQIVREGMRLGVKEGTASALNMQNLSIAAKTGTAQVGVHNEFANSWVMGFFPYESPRYAFVIVMERGPAGNLVGATSVARQFFDWLVPNAPEYTKALTTNELSIQ